MMSDLTKNVYRVHVTQGILVSPGFSYSRYLRYLNPHLGQDSVLRGEGAVTGVSDTDDTRAGR